jgi:hypothetical protein
LKFLYLLLVFLTTAGHSLAATKAKIVDACPSGTSLEENGTEECDDNVKFAQAGQTCLKALESDIRTETTNVSQQLAAANADHTSDSANSQTSDFNGSVADYALSQETLSKLLKEAQFTRDSVDNYLHRIFYPEDFDAEEEEIGDPLEFLDKNPCYVDNETLLKSTLASVDKDIANLKKAKASSGGLKDNSSTSSGFQDSMTSPNVSNTQGQGSGAATVKGTSNNGASDITGVKQDEQKQTQ